MLHKPKNLFFLIAGHLFLGLGLIGAFLPLLPTTPFLILAAFCYSRGSKKMHQWILNRPHVGPAVRDWEDYGVIRRKGKIYATLAIILSFVMTIYFSKLVFWVKFVLFVIIISLLIFIHTRPDAPNKISGRN